MRQIAYWAARLVPSEAAWNRLLQAGAIGFWLGILGAMGFVSVRAINTGLTELSVYRALGYITDSGMATALAWLVGGFVGAVWAAYLAIRSIRIVFDGMNRIDKGVSVAGQLASGFYPLFAFAAMLGLAAGAWFAFHHAITEAIPDFVATPDDPMGYRGYETQRWSNTILPTFAGVLAAMGALYLALRLIADAVKHFLRADGVISDRRKDSAINESPGRHPPSRVLWRRD